VTQSQLFYNDKNAYPLTLTGGAVATDLQGAGYVSSTKDPFDAAAGAYQYTIVDGNGNNQLGQLTANMTDNIRAWSIGPNGVSNNYAVDDVGYSNQSGALGV
jgi:hypothetical protein